jgi:hypothetical protein
MHTAAAAAAEAPAAAAHAEVLVTVDTNVCFGLTGVAGAWGDVAACAAH